MWTKGTLCITIAANIAKTGILNFDACFPDSVVAFTPNKKCNQVFIQMWMSFLQQIIEANAPESAQKNINLKILSDLQVILPPIELQDKFQKIVYRVEELKEKNDRSLVLSEELFNSLMKNTFNGNLFNYVYE